MCFCPCDYSPWKAGPSAPREKQKGGHLLERCRPCIFPVWAVLSPRNERYCAVSLQWQPGSVRQLEESSQSGNTEKHFPLHSSGPGSKETKDAAGPLKASLWDAQLDSVLIQGMKRDQHSRRCILLGIFGRFSPSWAASQPLASAGELQSPEAGRTDVQPGDELKMNSIFDCYEGEKSKIPCPVQKNTSVKSLLLCRACDHDLWDVVKVK